MYELKMLKTYLGNAKASPNVNKLTNFDNDMFGKS